MASIDELRVLTEEEPIPYTSKLLVYFIFEKGKELDIVTTRYKGEALYIKNKLKEACKKKSIKIIVVWPGQWRSEAFVVDPKIAYKDFEIRY